MASHPRSPMAAPRRSTCKCCRLTSGLRRWKPRWARKRFAAEDGQAAERLHDAVRELYRDAGRELFADEPDKHAFSPQANALAVLAGVTDGAQAKDLIERVSADNGTLVQCSIYFRH